MKFSFAATTWRRASFLAGLLLAGLLLAALPSCRKPLAPKARNLLLISLDTVRADHLGAYGATGAATPNLDRVAREGALFSAASSAVPLTLPSHASLLTGLLPPHHGLRLNGFGRLADDQLTLAEHLAAAGFDTAAFVGAFVLDHRFGLDQGFQVYDDLVARSAGGQAPRLESERPANLVVDEALSWLRRRAAGAPPFFAFVHLYDAHAPYAPPEPWRSRFAERPYDGEIAFADQQVGRLLDELAARGELETTLVAVVADHGESLGEHGEKTHGLLLYEPALRVPLLLRAPGQVPAGLVVDNAVSLVDVAPTLAALLGSPLPSRSESGAGRDLSPALRGEELEPRVLYAETEYPASFGWSPLAATRRDNLKLILSPRPELFELTSDPGESRDRQNEERRSVRLLEDSAREIRAGARQMQSPAVDDEARRRLAALGYAAGAAPPSRQPGEGAHPLDRLVDFHRWEQLEETSGGGGDERVFAQLAELVAGDPGNPIFRSSLARVARHLGKTEQALALYRQAIAAAPADPDAWQDLAAAFHELGQSRESAAAAREALALDPRRPEALTLLALAELATGRPEEARRHLAAALELDPNNATARTNLGNLLRAAGELAAAEAEYRRALAIAPALTDALNGLGVLLVAADRPREAIPLFARALQLEDGFEEARLNLGIAARLAGDEKLARATLEELRRRTAGRPRLAAEHRAALELLGLQHP